MCFFLLVLNSYPNPYVPFHFIRSGEEDVGDKNGDTVVNEKHMVVGATAQLVPYLTNISRSFLEKFFIMIGTQMVHQVLLYK